MKRHGWIGIGLFLLAPAARAGEVSLLFMPHAAVEYEGTGYREHPQGWELKVKPHGSLFAARWRGPLPGGLERQVFYLRNDSYFHGEDGNSAGPVERQSGQTRLALETLMADVRIPLAESSLQALVGVLGARAQFDRKDIVNNGVAAPGDFHETVAAAGAYVGFGGRSDERPGFYGDWEVSIAHLFYSQNSLRSDGATIRQGGYGYAARGEVGYRRGAWKWGAGFYRQLLEVMVPGGRSIENGASVSLPINKLDFFGPFLGVTYVY